MNSKQMFRYKIVVENANDLIVILNKNLEREFINEYSYYKLLGYTKKDLIGANIMDIIHPEDKKVLLDVIDTYAEEKNSTIQLRIKNYKGNYIWFGFRANPFIDHDNQEKVIVIGRKIQKEKEIEKKLANTQKKFRKIMEAAKDGILLLDNKGKVCYWNKAAQRIYGYTEEEILGKSLQIVMPEYDHKNFETIMNQFGESGLGPAIGNTLQFEAIKKNGTKIPVEVSYSSIKLEDQWNAVGIIRDISERKAAELKIKKSEERYRLISENANDLIIILNREIKIAYINESALFRILGYREKEIINMALVDFLHPADIEKAAKTLKNGILNGEVTQDFRVFHKNGKIICLEVKGKVFTDVDNKRKGLLVCRDITERKEAESQIKKSEQYYRLISENANDMIRVLNHRFEVEYLNENVHRELLGYEKKELLGKSVFFLFHRQDIINEKRKIYKGLRHGAKHEIRHRHKEGHYIWVEIKGQHFTLENGKKKTLLIGRDVTDRKIQENLIQEQIKRLNEINKVKTQLLRRISHELKTPLISIKGYADLLLELYNENMQLEEISIIKEIKNGCARLEDLIIDLIESSSLESGEIRLEKTMEDLIFLIQYVVKDLKPMINKRNHSILVYLHEELITRFEKEKIYEVLSNLLTNAIKYTPPNGTIKIKTIRKPKFYLVCVEDNGIGLTKKEKRKIFKQFGKIERYGQGWDIESGGTGLGLYIAKMIVELHGGQIWVKSDGRNEGSKFCFTLPIKS